MNWKAIFLLPACVVELISVLVTGDQTGFGDWACDRVSGDPQGRLFQTREQAYADRDYVSRNP